MFIKYCVFSKIFKYIPDFVSACVHWTSRFGRQMARRTPALQQNWQSLEKSQLFKEKTQYLMNTLYIVSICYEIYITTNFICLLRKS